MTDKTRELPIQQWAMQFEVVVDEAAALDAWRLAVKAQGWSAVGDPKIAKWEVPHVVGLVIAAPDLNVEVEDFLRFAP